MRKSEDAPMAGAAVGDVPVEVGLIQAAATEVNVDANVLFCIDGQKGGTVAKRPAAIEHIMLLFSPGADVEAFEEGNEIEPVDLGIECS